MKRANDTADLSDDNLDAGPPSTERPKIQISSLDELDAYLLKVEATASDDDLRAMFRTFEWRRDRLGQVADPYSAEYYEREMRLYREIAGVNQYDAAVHEQSEYDLESAVQRPYPYRTNSAFTVGDHLIGIGFLIQAGDFKPGSNVLEFGPGWGNTTLALAQLGCNMTVVEIEARHLELIRRRLGAVGLSAEAVHGDFMVVEGWSRSFDSVLFFESFHHCGNHLQLLKAMESLVSPDGSIVFASEPVLESFPVPWGVRTDGWSLWSIRRFGWLELGFKESYFVRTLMGLGWTLTKHVCPATTIGTVLVARRHHGVYEVARMLLPPDEDRTWALRESDPDAKVRWTKRRSVITLDGGAWKTLEVDMTNYAPFEMPVRLTCGGSSVTVKLAPGESRTGELERTNSDHTLVIEAKEWSPKTLGINSDSRILGVTVRQVRTIR